MGSGLGSSLSKRHSGPPNCSMTIARIPALGSGTRDSPAPWSAVAVVEPSRLPVVIICSPPLTRSYATAHPIVDRTSPARSPAAPRRSNFRAPRRFHGGPRPFASSTDQTGQSCRFLASIAAGARVGCCHLSNGRVATVQRPAVGKARLLRRRQLAEGPRRAAGCGRGWSWPSSRNGRSNARIQYGAQRGARTRGHDARTKQRQPSSPSTARNRGGAACCGGGRPSARGRDGCERDPHFGGLQRRRGKPALRAVHPVDVQRGDAGAAGRRPARVHADRRRVPSADALGCAGGGEGLHRRLPPAGFKRQLLQVLELLPGRKHAPLEGRPGADRCGGRA